MAAFNTIVARAGFVEEMKLRLNEPAWDGLVAESEEEALELARDKFEQDAARSDWTVAPESVEAWEMEDQFGHIGWDIEAGGWSND